MIDRGAALVFTTKDDVVALRERVSRLHTTSMVQDTHHRFDKVQHGVRVIFEVERGHEVPSVQQHVVQHARDMAQLCGLLLLAPSDWNVEQQLREEASATKARRPRPSKTSAAPEDRSKTDKAKEKTQTSSAPKPDAKPEPAPPKAPKPAGKPPDKPKDKSKPREEQKPKEEKKPRLPRLPGPHPEPIAPIPEKVTVAVRLDRLTSFEIKLRYVLGWWAGRMPARRTAGLLNDRNQ
jgi:hypothetical protein